jgi:CubicO group peptidase (beta-lactamase class C family)
VLARVNGSTYEQAVRDLVLEPHGLDHTFGFGKEIMTYRFVSGHQRSEEGDVKVVRPWGLPRSGSPAGGWTATIGDQLAWARLHLGLTPSRLLSAEILQRMQQPTAHMPGSALGDAVGISWLLADVNGTLMVNHGGATIGQLSDFAMLPEHGFGFVSMTNCAPNGGELNGRLREWAFEHYLGITAQEPDLADLSDADLARYEGRYVSSVADLVLRAQQGQLIASVTVTDRSVLPEGEPADQPDIPLALLVGEDDRYVVPSGEAKGMRGYFSRDETGVVTGINLSGRHMSRSGA